MSADQEAFLAALTYVVTPTHDSIRRLPAGTCFSNSFQMLTAVQAVMVFGFKYRGGGIAQWVERPTENPDAILMQVRIPGVAFLFLSHSQLSVQTFLRCPYRPRVQSHASTSVRTLKIPNTGSHAIVWTHENTALTDW